MCYHDEGKSKNLGDNENPQIFRCYDLDELKRSEFLYSPVSSEFFVLTKDVYISQLFLIGPRNLPVSGLQMVPKPQKILE